VKATSQSDIPEQLRSDSGHSLLRRAIEPVYKYLPSAYATGMTRLGKILIGTLYDFRRTEHGSKRSDPNEGTITNYLMPAPFRRRLPHDPLEPDQEMLVKTFGLTEVSDLRMANVTVIAPQQSGDLWVYCTSRKYDRRLMKKFKADACVRIDNPAAFFRAITRAFRDDITGAEHGPCLYGERNRLVRNANPFPIHFLKEQKYSGQEEYRSVWSPKLVPISRTLMVWPELTLFCARHEANSIRPLHAGVLFEGRMFEDMELQLDDLVFVDCTFRRCRLVYAGGPVAVQNPTYQNCEITLASGAGAGAGLLHSVLSANGISHDLLTELRSAKVLPDRPADVLVAPSSS
jgi:hypothetical protein